MGDAYTPLCMHCGKPIIAGWDDELDELLCSRPCIVGLLRKAEIPHWAEITSYSIYGADVFGKGKDVFIQRISARLGPLPKPSQPWVMVARPVGRAVWVEMHWQPGLAKQAITMHGLEYDTSAESVGLARRCAEVLLEKPSRGNKFGALLYDDDTFLERVAIHWPQVLREARGASRRASKDELARKIGMDRDTLSSYLSRLGVELYKN